MSLRPFVLVATTALAALSGTTVAQAQPFQDAAGLQPLASSPAPGTPAPVVCVIDTGVTVTPLLDGRVVARDTVTDDPAVDDGTLNPSDPASGHGTFVAETIATVWPHARIASVRAADSSGALTSLYPQAINACRNLGANVINLSLGGAPPSSDQITTTLRQAISKAHDAGIDTVVAAGNAPGPVLYPASALGDIAAVVAAVDDTGALCSFGSNGPEVLLGAPGCPVELPSPATGQLMAMSGSSFSAPQVAATLAAVQAYAPNLNVDQRRALLTGLPGNVLNGGEVLRRAGRGDLAPLPVAAPAPAAVTTAPATTAAAPASKPKPKPKPVAQAARPTFTVRWSRKRLVVRAAHAPKSSRLVVRLAGRKKALSTTHTTLTIPRALSRPRTRLTLRLETRGGKRLASRTVKSPRR